MAVSRTDIAFQREKNSMRTRVFRSGRDQPDASSFL
jgi:hypothetical protein